MAEQPNGGVGVFLSYVQADNEDDRCRITKWFHGELQKKVRLFGGEVEFFLDDENIEWGEDIPSRIEQSVVGAKLLMPIITARYFRREWCRRELQWFLDHEQSMGRNDLIVPIYFIESEDFERLKAEGDPLAIALWDHKLIDLHKKRDKMRNRAGMREQEIEDLARRLLQALKRVEGVTVEVEIAESPPLRSAPARSDGKGAPDTAAESKPEVAPVDAEADAGPGAVTVGAGGDYATLAEAVAGAAEGSELVLRPGLHEGGVLIEKTLHLRGEGQREAVVEAAGVTAITFKGPAGGLQNLVVRQTAEEGEATAVEIQNGRIVVEGCELESRADSCLRVSNAADPQVRGNVIRGGGNGIEIVDHAQGRYEDNEVMGAPLPGIAAVSTKSPTIWGNRVHGCGNAGILVGGGGSPRVEANEIYENEGVGIAAEGCAPVVRRNQIHDGEDAGITISAGAEGFFEENEIAENHAVGIGVDDGANPVVRRNRIRDGSDTGIYVHDEGKGSYEENELYRNTNGGAWVTTGASPVFVRNQVHDNPDWGIVVRDAGEALLEDNDIWGNDGPGVYVHSGGSATLRENHVHGGTQSGVYVDVGGAAALERNEIAGNLAAGVVIGGGADPVLRSNQIHGGASVGVLVTQGGLGTVEGNEIYGNATGGVWVENTGSPTVVSNELRDNGGPGLTVRLGGGGRAEANIIQGNADAGVSITEDGDPVLARNRIFASHGPGIFVGEGGRGTIEENDVFSNEADGVMIHAGGSPVVRSNAIHDGSDTGIYVNQGGTGQIEDNDVYGNARAGVWIQKEGDPTLTRNRIHDHQQHGIVLAEGGLGAIRENQVFRNLGSGIVVGFGCNPVVEGNQIMLNLGAGIALDNQGQVIAITGNALSGNSGGPIEAADFAVVQYYAQLNDVS